MTGAQIGDLIAAVVAVLGASAAYLKSRTASQSAAAAHTRLDSLPAVPGTQVPRTTNVAAVPDPPQQRQAF